MKKQFNQFLTVRNTGFVLLTIVFAFLLVYTLFNVYRLYSDTYLLQSADLYKIGSFKMQDKAYYHAGGKSSSPSYRFQSRDGYHFTIESSVYRAILDKRELRDTLQYHELTFTVYSDKETLKAFLKSPTPISINVLQFQIGNKMYIDLDKVNKAEEFRVISSIVAGLLFLSFLFYNFYKRMIQREEPASKTDTSLSY